MASRILDEVDKGSFVLEILSLDLNSSEPVPAFFTRPKDSPGPFPTVLYNHFHGGQYELGKKELLEGGNAIADPPYAEELARRGIAALCIDQWNFGERHKRPELDLYKETLWRGRVLWGMMVFDSLRAFDYLVARPDVDENRIATLGLSMGATMAWWLGALEERIKVVVDLCCMTDFEELIAEDGLAGHGIYYFVPSLLKHFDTVAINELIAPRPHLSLNGDKDPLTPPAGLDLIDQALRTVYEAHGAPDAWKMFREDHGHFESEAMRTEVLAWLERWL
ncbi:MAG: acetylxylan esterase [Cyanobacteria bacterium HKST-UBA02]|nr:acetylxylan esterase [Cyanobacteria bacterium HKST-UBA02]